MRERGRISVHGSLLLDSPVCSKGVTVHRSGGSELQCAMPKSAYSEVIYGEIWNEAVSACNFQVDFMNHFAVTCCSALYTEYSWRGMQLRSKSTYLVCKRPLVQGTCGKRGCEIYCVLSSEMLKSCCQ